MARYTKADETHLLLEIISVLQKKATRQQSDAALQCLARARHFAMNALDAYAASQPLHGKRTAYPYKCRVIRHLAKCRQEIANAKTALRHEDGIENVSSARRFHEVYPVDPVVSHVQRVASL